MDGSLNYVYFKLRKDFGRQPKFCETPSIMLDNVDPNKNEQKLYCLRNPVNQFTQTSNNNMSEHFVNTKKAEIRDLGLNHTEGGWPKDINFNDEEATTRYRRKVERDESYINFILGSYPKFQHYINQNNAIEMYNTYFSEMQYQEPVEKSGARIVGTFKDSNKRNVASICWTPEEDAKFVVAYCNKTYPMNGIVNKKLVCSIWDIEKSHVPIMNFNPPSACWQIISFPVEPKQLVGGLQDGRVCIFDLRYNKKNCIESPIHLAHRDPVSALLFMQSRLNTDFFSGSSDGKCMWWDVRNLSQPTEILIMSIRAPPGEPCSMANSEGISCLQYDKAFPTKFLCGTDTGFVIDVNRKGKNHNEVMSKIFNAHKGPVKAVHRSPCSSKMFITCGDWTSHIWSDDITTSPIVSGQPHCKQISDVVWAPQRVSSYMTICCDGKFRFWDLLRKYREPVLTLPLSKKPLTKIVPNEEGRLIAIGDTRGTTYIVSLSDSLILSGNRDKQLMIQCLERENRREHILEARVKEIKLKLKTEVTEATSESAASAALNEQAQLNAVEDEFRKIVSDELLQNPPTSLMYLKQGKMRTR